MRLAADSRRPLYKHRNALPKIKNQTTRFKNKENLTGSGPDPFVKKSKTVIFDQSGGNYKNPNFFRITIPAVMVNVAPIVLISTIFPASLLLAPIASAMT